MIFLLTGYQNEGKTLGLTTFVFKDFLEGREIYTNTPFAFPHTLINKDFLKEAVNNGTRFKNTSWALDEFWLWADSRARNKTSMILSYFYLQSSKDNMNIYFTAQTGRQNDVRLRENLHYWAECSRQVLKDKKFYPIPEKYRMLRKDLPKEIQDNLFIKIEIRKHGNTMREDFIHVKTKYIFAKEFYNLYDTEQKIKV